MSLTWTNNATPRGGDGDMDPAGNRPRVHHHYQHPGRPDRHHLHGHDRGGGHDVLLPGAGVEPAGYSAWSNVSPADGARSPVNTVDDDYRHHAGMSGMPRGSGD